MVVAGLCLILLCLAARVYGFGKPRPLDRAEILRIRHYSDQVHRDSFHPFG